MRYLQIFVFCFFVIQTILAHGCFQREREALLDFKASVSDPSGSLVSWRGKECCTWAGIKCSNQTGHVVKLNISVPDHSDSDFYDFDASPGNILNGEISRSLLGLEDLKHLDLSNNNFIGNTFPDFICSFRNLKYLDLHNTGLSGIIPSQLSNLSKLYYLDLSYNDLSGIIPPEFSNLSKLQYLSLGATSHSGNLPIIANIWWLSHLTSLKNLDLSWIILQNSKEWVQVLNMLPSLENLYLEGNNLTTITPSISVVNFSSLTTFYISDNNFNTLIPDWIGKLINLTELALVNCSFVGPIPNIFGNLNSLDTLLVRDNLESSVPVLHNLDKLTRFGLINININEDITELMSKFSNETLEKLEYLYLRNTSLTGNLTGWLNKMTNLKSLYVDGNKLNGTIPTEIGNLVKLVSLMLSGNSFMGEISETHLTGLSNLEFLDLSSNSINITLGTKWAPLFQLVYLDVSACQLGPMFPSWLKNQSRLFAIDLSYTGIADSLPYWLENLSSLFYINLSHNKIAGTVPNSLSSLTRLSLLELKNNNLTGEFPSSLQFCKNLIVLDLGENQFYGKIPEWLGETLQNLTVLRLRSNSFSGNIPSQLAHLRNLQVLDLSDNNISGSIPQNMDMLTAMTMPYHYGKSNSPLSNFQHSTLLCNLSISVSMKGSELQYSTLLVLVTSIDLSRNQLTGEIPQSITSLLGLRNLNLSYNQLDGTIPKEIGKMQSLESLDFCMNEISGIIPYNLSNLNFLTTLNLSYNNFSGKIPTGDQLQTLLDPSIYMDNPYLCGSPLNKSCSTSENSHDFNVQGNDNNLDEILLVLFTVLGFGFGFWMFFGVLIFKRNWRYQLFQMVDDILDRIYVPVMVFIARSCNDTTE